MKPASAATGNKTRFGVLAILGTFAGVVAAAPALASGAGAESYATQVTYLTGADGISFETDGPNPSVGTGVSSFTHANGYFDTNYAYFNGVGFGTYNTQGNRTLDYEISDTNGNYVYYVSGYTYNPGDGVQAAWYHNSGNSWHFNWWDTNTSLNVGVNANNAYANSSGLTLSTVGADGWGGCSNSYPLNDEWDWIYRYASNSTWYYFGSDSTFSWGSSPTWSVGGDAASGQSVEEWTS
ncbi:MAG: hypothetical protein KGR26_08600, partial [Cyanobacteria bacterium REEB65]|nr:hypothetical protein [Cyanobacteria bacterium REEB65]